MGEAVEEVGLVSRQGWHLAGMLQAVLEGVT